MEFSESTKVRQIQHLLDALFEHVLYDEEPLFISDEATMLDVSAAPLAELLERCAAYYRTTLTVENLREPLWRLLPELERCRTTHHE